jgi:hypothetical protein
MGTVYGGIDGRLRDWIEAQQVFFVATAPLAADGHVNLSPRGLADTFRVLDEHRVAWLDLTGSGAETIAHLRENGRIVLMFCAFSGPPKVVRLHGTGRVVVPREPEWEALSTSFAPGHAAPRAVVVVQVARVSDSCGYAVPTYEFTGERDVLDRANGRKSEATLADYRSRRNATSIDGLPALRADAAR